MIFGHNIKLSRKEVQQAILARIVEVAKAQGQTLDLLDLSNCGEVHFLNTEGAPVTFEDVAVTWTK